MVRRPAAGSYYKDHFLVLSWNLLKRVLGAYLISSPGLSLRGIKVFFSKFLTSSLLFVIGWIF